MAPGLFSGRAQVVWAMADNGTLCWALRKCHLDRQCALGPVAGVAKQALRSVNRG